MYLAFFDESESYAKDLRVVAGIVVDEEALRKSEQILAFLREFEVPEEHQDKFEEFHTSDLFNSRGMFAGVPRDRARKLVEKQGHFIGRCLISIFYSAVDVTKLRETVFRNANPLTVAFRMVLIGSGV